MSIKIFVGRLMVFVLVLATPFAVVGLSVGGLRGLAISGLLLMTSLVFAAFSSEKGLQKVYRAQPGAPSGCSRSLNRVVANLGGIAPDIHSFMDPAPQALVVRGLFSPGAILLSEGLLGILSEEELRDLLNVAIQRIRNPEMPFRTLCAWLAHLTLVIAPRAWLGLLFGELKTNKRLGALNALCFLPVFSAAKFFVSLGRLPAENGAYDNAPRAFTQLSQLTSEVTNPGSGILHLVDPWTRRSLFPL